MISGLRYSLVARVVMLAISLIVPTNLLAQDKVIPNDPLAKPPPKNDLCAVAITKATASGQSITILNKSGALVNIIVPTDQINEMIAKGLVVSRCSGSGHDLTEYRSAMCRFASHADSRDRAEMEASLGVSPEDLCAAVPSDSGE